MAVKTNKQTNKRNKTITTTKKNPECFLSSIPQVIMIVFLGSYILIINDVLIWSVTVYNDILRFDFFPGKQRKVKEDFWDVELWHSG